jgi:hypothetical protein
MHPGQAAAGRPKRGGGAQSVVAIRVGDEATDRVIVQLVDSKIGNPRGVESSLD